MNDIIMQSQPGPVYRWDEASQARALAEIDVVREVRERFVDRSTAELLLSLWTAALTREQIVDPKAVEFLTLDGVGYRVWSESGGISMLNPRGALGVAGSAVRRLARIVAEPSANDCAELEAAVAEMQAALQRIRDSPCWRRR